jgi:hypothetical protein
MKHVLAAAHGAEQYTNAAISELTGATHYEKKDLICPVQQIR